MARMARLVVPNYPHHVTQRGNRRQRTFFSDADYRTYIRYMSAACIEFGVDVWAYCLMPNHIHLIVVPDNKDGLSNLFRDVHRRYTCHINKREGWTGHLWQGRFHSSVMDEQHLIAAVRYVELNPVRAGLCISPTEWRWSSAIAHVRRHDNSLVKVAPLLKRIPDWQEFLAEDKAHNLEDAIRKCSRTGRPLGSDKFIDRLEAETRRRLRPGKPGRQPHIS